MRHLRPGRPGPAALDQLRAGPHPARAERPVWGKVVSAQHPGGLGDRGLGSAQVVLLWIQEKRALRPGPPLLTP